MKNTKLTIQLIDILYYKSNNAYIFMPHCTKLHLVTFGIWNFTFRHFFCHIAAESGLTSCNWCSKPELPAKTTAQPQVTGNFLTLWLTCISWSAFVISTASSTFSRAVKRDLTPWSLSWFWTSLCSIINSSFWHTLTLAFSRNLWKWKKNNDKKCNAI